MPWVTCFTTKRLSSHTLRVMSWYHGNTARYPIAIGCQYYLNTSVSVEHLVQCLFLSWWCSPAVGRRRGRGQTIPSSTHSAPCYSWQGSRAELQCRWVSLGRQAGGRRDCNIKAAAPRGVEKEENLPLCRYHLVLDNPNVRKDPLNIYPSAPARLDQLWRTVLVRGVERQKKEKTLLNTHLEGLIALQSCNIYFFILMRKIQMMMYILFWSTGTVFIAEGPCTLHHPWRMWIPISL